MTSPSSASRSRNEPLDIRIARDLPTLRLTRRQKRILHMSHARKRGWQTKLAQTESLSIQAVSKSLHQAERKAKVIQLFSRLLNGDVDSFFQGITQGWQSPNLRKQIWPLLKPGVERLPFLREALEQIEEPLLRQTRERFHKAKGLCLQENPLLPKARNFAITYNLLVTTTYICGQGARELLEELQESCPDWRVFWLLRRMVARGFHLLEDENLQGEYRAQLIGEIQHPDQPGSLRDARYILAYFDAVDSKYPYFYLSSNGRQAPAAGCINYPRLIREAFVNIREPMYREYPIRNDTNFLRLLLIFKCYPQNLTCSRSRNALRVICQIARHSSDPFVRDASGEVLRRMCA